MQHEEGEPQWDAPYEPDALNELEERCELDEHVSADWNPQWVALSPGGQCLPATQS